jgi:hypothetical protein
MLLSKFVTQRILINEPFPVTKSPCLSVRLYGKYARRPGRCRVKSSLAGTYNARPGAMDPVVMLYNALPGAMDLVVMLCNALPGAMDLVVMLYNALPGAMDPIVMLYKALLERWNPIADASNALLEGWNAVVGAYRLDQSLEIGPI